MSHNAAKQFPRGFKHEKHLSTISSFLFKYLWGGGKHLNKVLLKLLPVKYDVPIG